MEYARCKSVIRGLDRVEPSERKLILGVHALERKERESIQARL